MNADTPILISVLVPVYGVERWIGDCARSLFSQTMWEGIEFIFVDDASPDASIEILGKALAEYPARVAQTRLLHHPETADWPPHGARRSRRPAANGCSMRTATTS